MTRKKTPSKPIRYSIKKGEKSKRIVDILICHGKDEELVDDLINLGKSIGFSTSSVEKLPSYKFPQNDKVTFAINNSSLVVILATFNPDEPGSNNARPNVYDELRLAFTKKPKDLIVLQETNDSDKKVDLPSNLEGKNVKIEFNRNRLHKMYPQLLSEIRLRVSVDNLSGKLKSGGVLNNFLDQMDKIWDNEFDKASDKIDRDWETENKFQTLLDEFFQEYWAVFDKFVRDKVNNEELEKLCYESIKNAKLLAINAWRAVADGKYKSVEKRIKDYPKSKGISEITKKIDTAYQLIRKKRDEAEEKIQDYMKAIDELQDCLTNL